MSDRWQRLGAILGLCQELNRVQGLLEWDQQTNMPKGGIETRAETTATIESLAHQSLTSSEVGELLAALEEECKALPFDSDRASLVRVTRRAYDQAVKVPSALVSELAKASSFGQVAWEEARAKRDFAIFEPRLERIVRLQIEKAEALSYEDEPYDALLDVFEPEMKTRDVTALFTRLREDLVPLVQAISERADTIDDALLTQDYAEEAQWDFTVGVIHALGFDLSRGRQDRSTHPFTVGISPNDVRLTTRIDRNNLASALYSSIHEAGHGIYEQGLPVEHSGSFLGQSSSLGIHESQSRLWENVVGRSRRFWQCFLPRIKECFPNQFAQVDVDTIYRAVNKVQYPSPIRVEADEVNYNLHIFIRFELERSLISGDLAVRDLPSAWNEKTHEYLGFTPKDDAQGVLQDVHWSAGLFGYFPTYSLGTILSVQLYNQAIADHPQIPDEIGQGEFATLKSWMQEHIHRHGARYTPVQLIERATGGPLDPKPYVTYIREKFRDLYNL